MHSKAIEAAARAILQNIETVSVSGGVVASGYEKAAHACITAYLAAMEAEGFVMVPVEATEEMIDAGFDHHPKHFEAQMGRPPTPEEDMDWQYRAMLSARPNVKG